MSRLPIRIPVGPGQEMDPGVVLRVLDPLACCPGPVPFQCSIFTVAPASRTSVDRHSVRECWFIAQGRGCLSSDAGPAAAAALAPAEAGDAFLFDGGVGHSIENTGPGPLLVISVWWP